MFELRLVQGSLLKKIVEIIKDLVNNTNFNCSSTGFSLQDVDSRHGVMVSMLLRSEGFEHYRSDRDISLGMNLENLAKNLKRADNDDIITIKADDGTGNVTFMFENPAAYGGPRAHPIFLLGQDNIAGFEMKWTVIDCWNFELPEVEHEAVVRMPSSQFARICKDLSDIGDTVVISVTKEGVKFSTRSDIGTDETVCLQNSIEEETVIEMNQPVSKTFALRYANTFTKAIPLSSTVKISLSSWIPVIVEYKIVEMGYVRFYLARGN